MKNVLINDLQSLKKANIGELFNYLIPKLTNETVTVYANKISL